MTEFTLIIALLSFLMTATLTSRPIYTLSMKNFTRRANKKFGFSVSELNYSYDQMVYFISLPTSLPHVKSVRKEDLIIEEDFSSFLNPTLKGLNISMNTNSQKLHLAYLPVGNFRIPYLDRLQHEGRINQKTYLKISTSKLLHPKTVNEVREEVYKQLQVGRY